MNKITDILSLSLLQKNDIEEVTVAFKEIGWNKPKKIYENYLDEQRQNKRLIYIARAGEKFVGYVTLKWESDYPFFKLSQIPEISDLNVLPQHRKQGIATQLIHQCEILAKEHQYPTIGLGVGMTTDYGNAQRLYVKLGYIPDGHGLHYKNKTLNYGDTAIVDDDLVLYFTKIL